MKKIICSLCLLLVSMLAMAHTGAKGFAPPVVVSVHSQLTIGCWQAPVTLTQEESIQSAQVVAAYPVYRPALAYRRWPTAVPQTLNPYRSNYTYNSHSARDAYPSFTQALAVIQ